MVGRFEKTGRWFLEDLMGLLEQQRTTAKVVTNKAGCYRRPAAPGKHRT